MDIKISQLNRPIGKLFLITGILTFALLKTISAQDIEPRSYSVVPIGLHVAAVGYTYSFGDVISDGSSPIRDGNFHSNAFNLAYVQSFGFFKKLAKITVALPYGVFQGTANILGVDTGGKRYGFADARLKFSVNLIGAPLISPRDFRKFQEETVFGASLVISIPTGQYDPQKLINIGSNRWGFKPELGFSERLGRFYIEAYSGVWFFTTNNEFFKSSTLKENALFNFQAHVDYILKSGIWFALNGGYGAGGSLNLSGKELDNGQSNFRAGATFSVPFNKNNSIRLMYNTGVTVLAGQNYSAFTLSYQYSWF